MATKLNIVGEREADKLLSENPLALLIGMQLDQQFPMEHAFAGPKKIADRMGGFEVHAMAEADPEEFAKMCSTPPAVHRFPGSMAKKIQALCALVIEQYGGRAEGIWTDGDPDANEVLKRLKALPSFGDQKARIFLALLGKQVGVQPAGWEQAAGSYSEQGSRRSVADVVDSETLAAVRQFKKDAKAAAKAAKG